MGSREHRNIKRVRLEKPLNVVMGSIGSSVRYDLLTRDVSSNGFFLDFDKPGRFPFTPSSIMEVWMELDRDKVIFFNGKMARVVYPNDSAAQVSGPGIAIRIVQMGPVEERQLLDFIRDNQPEQPDGDTDLPDDDRLNQAS